MSASNRDDRVMLARVAAARAELKSYKKYPDMFKKPVVLPGGSISSSLAPVRAKPEMTYQEYENKQRFVVKQFVVSAAAAKRTTCVEDDDKNDKNDKNDAHHVHRMPSRRDDDASIEAMYSTTRKATLT